MDIDKEHSAENDAPWCPECGPTCPLHGTAENDVPLIAPPAEALIRELRAHHARTDPNDEHGFNSEEVWQYRLATFGYVQLFADWYLTVGQHRVLPSAENYPDMPCEDCEQGLSSCCIPPGKTNGES